jgi:hypothetical protein
MTKLSNLVKDLKNGIEMLEKEGLREKELNVYDIYMWKKAQFAYTGKVMNAIAEDLINYFGKENTNLKRIYLREKEEDILR